MIAVPTTTSMRAVVPSGSSTPCDSNGCSYTWPANLRRALEVKLDPTEASRFTHHRKHNPLFVQRRAQSSTSHNVLGSNIGTSRLE